MLVCRPMFESLISLLSPAVESVVAEDEAQITEPERVIVYARGHWQDGAVEEPHQAPDTELDNLTVNGETTTMDGDFDPDTTNEADELTVDGTEATSVPKLDRMDTLTEEATNDVTLLNEGWIVVDEQQNSNTPQLRDNHESDRKTTLEDEDQSTMETEQDSQQHTGLTDSSANDTKVVNDTAHDTPSANDPTNHQQQPQPQQTSTQDKQNQEQADGSVQDDALLPAINEAPNSDQSGQINDSSQTSSIQDKPIQSKFLFRVLALFVFRLLGTVFITNK